MEEEEGRDGVSPGTPLPLAVRKEERAGGRRRHWVLSVGEESQC